MSNEGNYILSDRIVVFSTFSVSPNFLGGMEHNFDSEEHSQNMMELEYISDEINHVLETSGDYSENGIDGDGGFFANNSQLSGRSQSSSMSSMSNTSFSQSSETSGKILTSDMWAHFRRDELNGMVYCNYCDWSNKWKAVNGNSCCRKHAMKTKSCGYFKLLQNKPILAPDLTVTTTPGVTSMKFSLGAATASGAMRQTHILQKMNGDDAGELEIVDTLVFKDKTVRAIINKMIIVDELPFRTVHKEGFLGLMRVLRPLYKVKSARTCKEDITKRMYPVYVEHLQHLLARAMEYGAVFSFTTDIWTCGVQHRGYMNVFPFRDHIRWAGLGRDHPEPYPRSAEIDLTVFGRSYYY